MQRIMPTVGVGDSFTAHFKVRPTFCCLLVQLASLAVGLVVHEDQRFVHLLVFVVQGCQAAHLSAHFVQLSAAISSKKQPQAATNLMAQPPTSGASPLAYHAPPPALLAPRQVGFPYIPASYPSILEFANSSFLLTCQATMLELLGQMLPVPLATPSGGQQRALLFLGSPRCCSLSDMQAQKVFLSDIPLHDMSRGLVILGEHRQVGVESST